MRVRIQMGQARPVQKDRPKNQHLASAAAVLLAPFAMLAAVLAIWRIAADLNFASAFLFHEGALAHWAVWASLAVFLSWATHRLNRYGKAAHEGEALSTGHAERPVPTHGRG